MTTRGRVLAIVGPTAAGKTALAVDLAERVGGELIGADSVQVVRGFDIGSAKPTASELRGVRHHLIDVLDPTDPVDAKRYADLADAAISLVASRGRAPIVVGGTGLWLRALLRGLVDLPAPDPALRARLEEEAETHGDAYLHARLASVDPASAEVIHPNDRVRVTRALEVLEQTGIPASEHRRAHALGAPRYDATVVAVDPGPRLRERIGHRVDSMLAAGWVDETRRLIERWGTSPRAFGSVGYREIVEHILLGAPRDELADRIKKSTRLYAKRQRNWFRGDPTVARWGTAEALLRSLSGQTRLFGPP